MASERRDPVRRRERRLTAEAFAEAFQDASRALWCIAAGVLGNRDGAEDVLQEGAIVALGKLDQFESGTSFLAWMGRIVRYVAMNHARKTRRAPTATAQPETVEPPAKAETPGERRIATTGRGELVADQTAFDDDVLRALRGLEETPRACLLMRTLLDMPYRDIALALDIPEGTAMSHVHRARRIMRERLREQAPRTAARPDEP